MPTSTPTAALFVLAGQSNAIPRGREVAVPTVPEDAGIVVTGLRWWIARTTPGSYASLEALGTYAALERGTYAQLETLAMTRAQAGPGLAFARAVVRGGLPRVGVLGCALGGSTIAQWQKGQPLYAECLLSVRATGLPVAGVVFVQGETDARSDGYRPPDGTPLHAADWGDLFATFVHDLRADTGQPDLPVVYGRLAHTTSPTHGNWSVVQAQQDAVAIPGVTLVDPEPVDLAEGDPVHWTDESYAAVGERLAAAYLAH